MIDFPNSPTTGQIFSSAGTQWKWDGTKWVVVSPTPSVVAVYVSDTPPANPIVGQQWWDSVGAQLYIWYNDGTSLQWVPSVPSVNVPVPNYQGGAGITVNNSVAPPTVAVTPGHIPGITDGSNAAAGEVGEYITVSQSTGQAAAASGSWLTITSMVLSAGDWDVGGYVAPAISAAGSSFFGGIISLSPAGVNQVVGTYTVIPTSNVGGGMSAGCGGGGRVNVNASQTVYLCGLAYYTTATITWTGVIWARRAR
jgi:hypothetical protein